MSGNLAEATKENESAVQTERWLYEWNPRDQLIRAEKRTGTGSGTYAGKVEYEYCLSCDGALSKRREYSTTQSGNIIQERRYEYDGLNLLRVDEKYDISGGSLDVDDPWRTLEVSTHRPGALGALLSKRVFTHTDNNDTADATNDYVYVYDPVGNVWVILASDGHEQYNFTQDAFGNELSIAPFNGTSWNTARTAGITEHQTGKWLDPFTGLYYFQARYYDPVVGRFVGRDSVPQLGGRMYTLSMNSPNRFPDPTGKSACTSCTSNTASDFPVSDGQRVIRAADPLGSISSVYPPVVHTGKSCSSTDTQKIQVAAFELFTKITLLGCMDAYPEARDCVLDRMYHSTVKCGGLWCCKPGPQTGYQRFGYNNIHVCAEGFDEITGGTRLPCTLLHEWLHSCNWDVGGLTHPVGEPDLGSIGAIVNTCFPNGTCDPNSQASE